MIRYWVKLPSPGQMRGEGDWIECSGTTARNHWHIYRRTNFLPTAQSETQPKPDYEGDPNDQTNPN